MYVHVHTQRERERMFRAVTVINSKILDTTEMFTIFNVQSKTDESQGKPSIQSPTQAVHWCEMQAEAKESML